MRSLPDLTDDEVVRCQAAFAPSRASPGGGPAGVNPESGFGALTTPRGCLPLKALDVRARVTGQLAAVDVRQTFVNTCDEPLEATYIFPLPDRAAVTRFRLEVAGRVIEGVLKERGEARQEYDRAVRSGHRAAITEEERPGVFTLRVGNLPPGEEAVVRLSLAGPLPYADGEATFRFPLVVAPRYIPGAALPGPSVGDGVSADTDAVPDASRISPPVLLPGFPNPVRVGLTVEFPHSPLAPSDLRSSLHAVLEDENSQVRRVRLQPGERLDRDFILRFRLAEDRIVTALSLQPDGAGALAQEGTFLLTLVPPVWSGGASGGPEPPGAPPRDVAFVLDRSGSMEGWKIVAARRALARMVDTLTDQDRFTLLAFDSTVETPPGLGGAGLVPATYANRGRAVEYLSGVSARGGTEMARPLDLAVSELARGGAGRERVLVLITDGQVGNEDQILRRLGPRLKGIRVFTLGIDQAVNAAFLRRLADLGGGASELVESEERLDEVMDQVHRRIGTPVLTHLRIEPAGLSFVPGSLVPGRMPDLFAGAPLLILGRYRGKPSGAIALQARDAAGQTWSTEVWGRREDNAALPSVWARGRLRELEDRYVTGGDTGALEREMVSTSLSFGVLCRFTAFVAVDHSAVVNPGGEVHGIVQPVEQPAGWGQDFCTSARGAHPNLAKDSSPARGGFGMMGALPAGAAPAARPAPLPVSAAPAAAHSEALGRATPQRQARRGPELAPPPHSVLREAGDSPGGGGGPDRPQGLFEEESPSPPGVIQRLRALFRRAQRKGKTRGAATAPVDRGPYRQRMLDLVQAFQGAAADTTTRLGILRSLAGKLQDLFQDLVAAGDRHPAIRRLGEALVRLDALLAEAGPAEVAVHEVWSRTEAALRDWLAIDQPAHAPGRREGFWK
jgi:Ca-activated chloride channel family protein